VCPKPAIEAVAVQEDGFIDCMQADMGKMVLSGAAVAIEKAATKRGDFVNAAEPFGRKIPATAIRPDTWH